MNYSGKSDKKFIEDSKKFWQHYYKNEILTDDDAIEIIKNTTAFLNILIEWNQKKKETDIANKKLNTPEIKLSKEVEEKPNSRLIPVTKWNYYYDYPPIGGLRHLIFNENRNGFNKVIRRVGRRVLIKEDEFFKWIEEINPKNLD